MVSYKFTIQTHNSRRDNMLVLTRRVSETITISDDIAITMLRVRRNQVKVGINVPKEISVHRQEIDQKIKALKKSTESQ